MPSLFPRFHSVVVVCFGVMLSMSAIPAHAAWFRFNTAFITSHYASGEAFGTLAGATWTRSGLHQISCSGKDGEVHIGALESDLEVPSGERPVSGPGDGSSDPAWGLVAELPNAGEGNGLSTYDAHATNKVCSAKITFDGYLRVWNEGHATGNSSGSNPHHVVELHPVWGFVVGGDHFTNRGLVKRIPGYSGYGASAFRSMLTAIGKKKWPKAYQENGRLFVDLWKHHNFFQLPVIVQSSQTIPGGHAVLVNVFSDKERTNKVYSGLRCITLDGSPIDGHLATGSKRFLLGFFSVNLKRALDGVGSAHDEASAVAVPEALEFLVFGRATRPAVKNNACDEED